MFNTQPGSIRRLLAVLLVLVTDYWFAIFLQSLNAIGNVVEFCAIEMNKQKVARLAHIFRESAIAQTACGNQQLRPGFFRQS